MTAREYGRIGGSALKRKDITQDKRDEMVMLRNNGTMYKDIAARFNVPLQGVYKIVQREYRRARISA